MSPRRLRRASPSRWPTRMREARQRRLASRGTPAPSPAAQRMEQLERLGSLRDSGVLSAEEFAAEKKRILDSA